MILTSSYRMIWPLIFILSILLNSGCETSDTNGLNSSKIAKPTHSSCATKGHTAGSNKLSLAGLKELICNKNLKSIDALLVAFKEDPEFNLLLESPVLNRFSQALHSKDATPEFPRIIMSAKDLIIQLSGNPELDSYRLMEIIEYLPEQGEYRFHLIHFAAIDTEYFFMDGVADFKEVPEEVEHYFEGVASCRSCHYTSRSMMYSELVPRWTTAPLWVPAFGQLQNRIYKGTQEHEHWQSFEANLKTGKTARYKLMNLANTVDQGTYLELATMPNSRLTANIVGTRMDRLANKIKDFPGYDAMAPAIEGIINGCGSATDFLPPDYLIAHEQHLRTNLSANHPVAERLRIPVEHLKPEALAELNIQDGRYKTKLPGYLNILKGSLYDSLKAWVLASFQRDLNKAQSLIPIALRPDPTRLSSITQSEEAGKLVIDLGANPKADDAADFWYLMAGLLGDDIASFGISTIASNRSFDIDDGSGKTYSDWLKPRLPMSNRTCAELKTASFAALKEQTPESLRIPEINLPVEESNTFPLSNAGSVERTLIINKAGLEITSINPASNQLKMTAASAHCDQLVWNQYEDWTLPTPEQFSALRASSLAELAPKGFDYRFGQYMWGKTDKYGILMGFLRPEGDLAAFPRKTLASFFCVRAHN